MPLNGGDIVTRTNYYAIAVTLNENQTGTWSNGFYSYDITYTVRLKNGDEVVNRRLVHVK
jgi:hypothetical protein